ALLTGILFGISPAWQLSRPQLAPLIQSSSARATSFTSGRNTHRMLIAGQVALTLLLLAGAGAAMKAVLVRTHTPLGFDPDHVGLVGLALPRGAAPTWLERMNQTEQVLQTIAHTPGVTSVGVSPSWLPGLGGFSARIEVQSRPTLTDAQAGLALVSPQLFE